MAHRACKEGGITGKTTEEKKNKLNEFKKYLAFLPERKGTGAWEKVVGPEARDGINIKHKDEGGTWAFPVLRHLSGFISYL